ncbi:hypothetical protein ACT453_02775 [Bacillus sp. D-CC]
MRYIEKLPSLAEDDINIPDIYFFFLIIHKYIIK